MARTGHDLGLTVDTAGRSPILRRQQTLRTPQRVAQYATTPAGPTCEGDDRVPDLYVDGSWVSALAGGRRTIVCPADGPVVGEVDEAGPDDTALAIDAAHRAFHEGPWPTTSARERGDLLLRTADLLERDADAVAEAESLDTGKRLVESGYDVADVVSVFRHYGRTAAEDSGRIVDTGNPDVVSRVVHEPLGVCGLIAPWNYPLLQASWKVAPCLAAGNTFVLKPSELTPHTSIHLMRLLEEAGPAGRRRQPGARRRARGRAHCSPRTPGSTWSPSPAACRPAGAIMAAAAATVKKVALELGGKNPNIVFADADLEVALDYALTAVFLHSGQVCSAGARLLVQEAIHDDFVDALVDRAGTIRLGGPLRREGRDRAADQRRAPRQGGGVRRRRRRRGRRAPLRWRRARRPGARRAASTTCRPILDGCTSAMSVTRDESFGPVLTVETFSDEDEAVAHRQRQHLRAGRRGLDPGRRQGAAGRRPAADGHGLDQRLPPVRPAGRVGRLQAVRHRPRARAGRPRGVPRDQARVAQHPARRAALVQG